MAFDLQFLKDQVNLYAGGHAGLDQYVTRWANLVLWDMATRAYWTRQMAVGFAHPSGASGLTASTPSSQWFTINVTNTGVTADIAGIAAIYRVDHVVMAATNGTGSAVISTYRNQVKRLDVGDLYNRAANASPAGNSGSVVNNYAIVQPDNNTAANMQLAVMPFLSNSDITAGGSLAVQYLGVPTGLSAPTDTTWMLTKYPHTVLSGVLQYVCIYLGDVQGFLVAKANYENGIGDALQQEEVHLAFAPQKRGIGSEVVNRG